MQLHLVRQITTLADQVTRLGEELNRALDATKEMLRERDARQDAERAAANELAAVVRMCEDIVQMLSR